MCGQALRTGAWMLLDELTLRTATFEFRYDQTFRIWDRAGELWSDVSVLFPTLKMGQAAPNDAQGRAGNKRFAAGSERALVTVVLPDAMPGNFPEDAEAFVSLVSAVYDIKAYTRIGFRAIYFKRFPDGKAAAERMLSLGLLKLPIGPRFGVEQAPFLQPEYALRVEGEALGYHVRVKAHELNIDLELPEEYVTDEIKPGKDKRHELVFDFDYFTTATVLDNQLKVAEWIRQVFHVMRRDTGALMGN